MAYFEGLIRNTIKYDCKIKKICAPLKNCLEISNFGYCSINQEGSYCSVTTVPQQMEFFYENELYLNNPYFKHPSLFESGYVVAPVTISHHFQEKNRSLFGTDHYFLILKKYGQDMKMYFFSKKQTTLNDSHFFLQNLHLLDKFTNYFDREADLLINSTNSLGYNCLPVLGDSFYESSDSIPLYSKEIKSQQFLKSIWPLTVRERTCLDMYKKGNSAQTTAAKLKISQRTVEHHFENIKYKLGCHSKAALLDF